MMDAPDESSTGHKSVEMPEKMPERARRALEEGLTFRSTSAIEVYETLREALAGDPGDAYAGGADLRLERLCMVG